MEKPWYNPFSRFIFTEKELFIGIHPFINSQQLKAKVRPCLDKQLLGIGIKIG
jgi:hypothetical protein